jgi:lipopolysaccharide biosynthesis regulator YciM
VGFQLLAKEAIQRKKFDDAHSFIKLAIEAEPDDLKSMYCLIDINFLRKNYHKVIEQSKLMLGADLESKYGERR